MEGDKENLIENENAEILNLNLKNENYSEDNVIDNNNEVNEHKEYKGK